jgi:anhydro-N-acetylmuramic acid kinase
LKEPPRDGAEHYVGLMSGTSLDGIDAVLAEIDRHGKTRLIAASYLPYSDDLRQRLLPLHSPHTDELHVAAVVGNELARGYADAVEALLRQAGKNNAAVRAIGCHGQTVRHRPDAGYTLQIGNAALLAELSGIAVVADFRSRDIAAGGQGAPLVPAFHADQLRHPERHRVVVNLGGIANVTDLPADAPIRGWDTGPGNMLMDAWIHHCQGKRFDDQGAWATEGKVIPHLLQRLLSHPYLQQTPPKSAGREQFNLEWLQTTMQEMALDLASDADVQATLLELTATTVSAAILGQCAGANEVFVCGGGVHNRLLMERISSLLHPARVASTATAGIDPDWMEALAFAWLARQAIHGQPANIPSVTGARGARVLGAIHPA